LDLPPVRRRAREARGETGADAVRAVRDHLEPRDPVRDEHPRLRVPLAQAPLRGPIRRLDGDGGPLRPHLPRLRPAARVPRELPDVPRLRVLEVFLTGSLLLGEALTAS